MIYSDCTTYKAEGKWGYIVTDERGQVLEQKQFYEPFRGVAFAEAMGVSAAVRYAPLGHGVIACDNQRVVHAIQRVQQGLKPYRTLDDRYARLIIYIARWTKANNIRVKWVPRSVNVAGIRHGRWVKAQLVNIPKQTKPVVPPIPTRWERIAALTRQFWKSVKTIAFPKRS